MIYTFIPYSPNNEKNLAKAYDNCMKLLKDDDILIGLDHDINPATHYQWHDQIEQIVKENPDFGLLTCMTNRVNCPLQLVERPMSKNHDMAYWEDKAKEYSDKYWGQVQWIDPNMKHRLISGLMMIIRKSTWEKLKPFKNILLGFDWEVHKKVDQLGLKVGIMKGVVVYHKYRIKNSKSHLSKG